MEESLILGVLKNSGIIGLVVVFLLFIVWQFFKFATGYIQASVENNKHTLEAKTAHNNSLIALNDSFVRQTESIAKLNESVVNGGQLIASKLEHIHREMKELATKELVSRNHSEVMAQIQRISQEIEEVLINLKK